MPLNQWHTELLTYTIDVPGLQDALKDEMAKNEKLKFYVLRLQEMQNDAQVLVNISNWGMEIYYEPRL